MATFSAIALDIGSTSIKCAGLTDDGHLKIIAQEQSPQLNFEKEKVWGDPEAYLNVCLALLQKAKKLTEKDCPLSITCQRSTFLVWNREGKVLSPLISWQDRFFGREGLSQMEKERVQELSGLVPSSYYLGPKLKGWLKHSQKICRDIYVGTFDTYLVWVLSSKERFVIDRSMAARTALMDLNGGDWSSELLEIFHADQSCLPSLLRTCNLEIGLQDHWLLQSMSADQSASLYGHDPEPGDICVNFGTGVFVMKVFQAQDSPRSCYQNALFYEGNQRHYFYEGAVNGLTRTLQSHQVVLDSTALQENDAFCLVDSAGLGAPYWRSELDFQVSLDNFTNQKTEFKRSVIIEGLAFRVNEMIQDLAGRGARVLVSGGASCDKVLMEFLSSLCPYPVFRADIHESSLRGALKFTQKEINKLDFHRLDKQENPYLQSKYNVWCGWKNNCLA